MKYTKILSAILSATMVIAPSAPTTTAGDNSATIQTSTATTTVCESAATPEDEVTTTNPIIVQEEAIMAAPIEDEGLAPAIAIEVDEEQEPVDIGPAICAYYVKPGDIKAIGSSTQLGFEHYARITETADGEYITLSGWSIGTGDWTYKFKCDGTPDAHEGEAPFVVNTGTAFLAPPLAATTETFELAGFTVEASENNMVSYYVAPGGYYLYGDNWNAAIVDQVRYAEIKYGHQNGNLPDDCNMKYVTNNGTYWVVASDGAPSIQVKDADPKAETDSIYAKIENAVTYYNGVTDPKYGAIQWGKVIEEYGNGASTYNIGGSLNGTNFVIEIDTADVIGFADEYNWNAAIVPSNVITQHNPSLLHINGYTINVDANGNAYVYNENTGVGREIDCPIANDEVVLVTISDGKHATVATFDVALLDLIWAIA